MMELISLINILPAEMEQKIIWVEDISLTYIEKNQAAKETIFFIHGNSGSSATWKRQINDARFSQYRLIALDLPGHGNSSRSNSPENDYSPLGSARILSRAVSSLCTDSPYILAGHSYGTNLVAEMLNFEVKPLGIILIGLCCIGEDFGMNVVFKQQAVPSIFSYNEKNMEILAKAVADTIQTFDNLNFLTADYLKTDDFFKPILMQAAAEGRISDEISALKKADIPLCIINGALDNLFHPDYIKNADLNFWSGGIHVLENAGHFVHLDKASEVNEIIEKYSKEIFTQSRVLQHSS